MEKKGTDPGGGRTMLRLRRKLCYSSKNSIYCDFNVFHFILVDPVIHEHSFRTVGGATEQDVVVPVGWHEEHIGDIWYIGKSTR